MLEQGLLITRLLGLLQSKMYFAVYHRYFTTTNHTLFSCGNYILSSQILQGIIQKKTLLCGRFQFQLSVQ